MRKRLLFEEGKAKYKKRLFTAEPPFGNPKHNLGYRSFLLRRLEKVDAEFKLMCIGHNLRRPVWERRCTLLVEVRRKIGQEG